MPRSRAGEDGARPGTPPGPPDAGEARLGKTDYERLARFRYALRQFLRFSEQAARSAGVTPQQYVLLLTVKGFPSREWATISELAERLQLRHNSAVGIVDRCVLAGLVQRQTDLADRRQVRVSLTPHGEEVLGRLAYVHRQELKRIRRDIGLLARDL